MGKSLSKAFGFGKRKEMHIVMTGLDAAGKTTILYKLKLGEVVVTVPSIGVNVETVTYKNITFTVVELQYHKWARKQYEQFYERAQAVIFVVDSNDRDRIDDTSNASMNAKDELHRVMGKESMTEVPLLIFANKQDLAKAMDKDQVMARLNVGGLRGNRPIHVQPSCATTGDGLYEGLDWLSNVLNRSSKS